MIRLSKSSISEIEKKAVSKVLDNEYLGMGDQVRKFEELLSNFFGRPAICVANGTAALQLAVQACGIKRNDEILVPSLTYVASFQSIIANNAVPIPCDISKNDFLIDLNDAKKKITKNTKAIMPVHYTGGVGELDKIYDFANDNNIRVIEDAAHAFGTKYNGSLVGSFGDIACFSFDGIKNITSGEGGCLVTNDEKVIKRVKDSRLLGVAKDTEFRYMGKRNWEFDVSEIGWRYHMSNVMAAIGISQFRRFESFKNKRRKIAKLYDDLLKDCKYLKPIIRDYDSIVPHIYVVLLNRNINRSLLRERLMKKGIETGIHYQPNHLLTLFRADSHINLPVTEDVSERILTLPLHFDLSSSDVKKITKVLDSEIQNFDNKMSKC